MSSRSTIRILTLAVRAFSSSNLHRDLNTLRPPSSTSTTIADHLANRKPLEAYHLFDKMLRSSLPHNIDPRLCNSLLASLAADDHLKPSITLFDTMLDRKITFTDLGFGVFVNRFCRNVELGETLSVLVRVEGVDGSVMAALVVDGLCRCGRVVDAWTALGEMRKIGCKPDFIGYQIVVEAFREGGRLEDARQVLKEKRKLGVAPRMNDYESFVLGLIRENKNLEAKWLVDGIVKGNFTMRGEFLDAVVGSISCDHVESAFVYFHFMIEKGFLPSPETVKCLASGLVRSGEAGKMWGVLNTLTSNNYFSDVSSYNAMISTLCEVGQVKEAYSVLKEMRAKGLSPDICSYNCLMEALCREDLVRPAKRLWDEMFTYGCSGNLQTYNVLIKKLSRTGEVEEARGLFYHMIGKEILPDNVSYSSLIKGMCREGRTDEAFEIFEKSLEQDKQLASSTLRLLISSLCKEGHFTAALKIMQCVPSSEVDTSIAHVILVKSLSERGEFKMAVDYLKEIKDKEPSKLNEIEMELMHSLSFSLNMDPTMRLMEEMRRIGVFSKNPLIDLPVEIRA